MNTPSASPVPRVLVWDLPTRVVHWLLAASFAGAWLTAESDAWRAVHVALGYTVAALVAFRLAWGIAGTRHARFTDFVKGPSAIAAYVRSLVSGRPEAHAGHNPLGAVAIVALLALATMVTATGYATYNDFGGHALEEVHEALAAAMLGVVLVHIAGVIVGSLAHHENLVRAMFTGRKSAPATEGIRSPRRFVALVVIALVGVIWWTQLDAIRHPPAAGAHASRSHHGSHHDKDDD